MPAKDFLDLSDSEPDSELQVIETLYDVRFEDTRSRFNQLVTEYRQNLGTERFI